MNTHHEHENTTYEHDHTPRAARHGSKRQGTTQHGTTTNGVTRSRRTARQQISRQREGAGDTTQHDKRHGTGSDEKKLYGAARQD